MIPSDTFLSLLHLDFVLLLHKNSFVRITKDFFEFAKSCGRDSVHLLDLSAASESSHCSFLLRALSLVGHASSLAFLLALWLLLLNMFLLASSHFSVLMGEPGLIYLVFFSFYLIHSVTLQCFHGFKYLPMSWWILMYLSSLKPSPKLQAHTSSTYLTPQFDCMMAISYFTFGKQLSHHSISWLLLPQLFCVSWWQLQLSLVRLKLCKSSLTPCFLSYSMSNIAANSVCTFFTIHLGFNYSLPPPLALKPPLSFTWIFLLALLMGPLALVFAQL